MTVKLVKLIKNMKTWHSTVAKQPYQRVYHDNHDCYFGTVIVSEYLIEGTGGRGLCKKCDGLNKKK